MAAKTRYKVAATMIVAKVPGAQGGEVYLNRGRFLPDTVDSKEAKRLLDLGLVERVSIDKPGTASAGSGSETAEGEAATSSPSA